MALKGPNLFDLLPNAPARPNLFRANSATNVFRFSLSYAPGPGMSAAPPAVERVLVVKNGADRFGTSPPRFDGAVILGSSYAPGPGVAFLL